MTASAERLMEIESFADDCTEPPAGRDDIMELYRSGMEYVGMDNVSFTYCPPAGDSIVSSKENMPVVLKNVSLKLRKGEYMAFTGQSGCGKSTVMKLMMRILDPDSGEIYIESPDGAKEPLGNDKRRLFAYVPRGRRNM